jgi:hypothetical protein
LRAVVNAPANEVDLTCPEAVLLKAFAKLSGEFADVARDGLRGADRLGECAGSSHFAVSHAFPAQVLTLPILPRRIS